MEGEIGSVVVNCNPFTLGHRYLIEKASKLCDYLYVFVVEENRSVFSFEDRIRLVKEGVADLENVKVLRSGQYIISSITFPEYFMKGGDDIKIDVSFDLEMFTDYVAPALNITRRFVGKEPMCHVTRQYNQQMKEILPRKGIEVYEFERIDIGGEPISASRVRKLFDDKEYDEVAKLVPKTTMKYLLESCKCE